MKSHFRIVYFQVAIKLSLKSGASLTLVVPLSAGQVWGADGAQNFYTMYLIWKCDSYNIATLNTSCKLNYMRDDVGRTSLLLELAH